MTRTTLQIPLDTVLRDKAEKAAIASGFSSVQEIVRVFLNKLASKSISVGFYEKDVILSKKAESRYVSMVNDARRNKNSTRPSSFDELTSILD